MMKIKDKYDVIILGAGASACACAVRCAELGLKVLCIDNQAETKDKKLQNGRFSHPSSLEIIAISDSARLLSDLMNASEIHGIFVENIAVDLERMVQRKNQILLSIEHNRARQFGELGVEFIHAKGKLVSSNTVEIHLPFPQKVAASHVVLATESRPFTVRCAPVDNKFIFDTNSAFNLPVIPKRLAIIGASVMGLELGGIWNRLGSEVILFDAQEAFLEIVDNHISREAYHIFNKQGLEIRLGTRVISTKVSNQKVLIEFQDADGNHAIRVDRLIVASGRRPNSDNLAAPEANLLLDENSFVHVTENCRTNLPSVYAIGDLNMLGPMLPQKGMAEGVYVAEQIGGDGGVPVNYETIPNVIYTDPEIAWVGQTEQVIKAQGKAINIGISPLASGYQIKAPGSDNGIVKIIACAKTDLIKGIHIFGHHASDLIAEAALAMEFSATTEDIARTVHSHPSLSESINAASRSIIDKEIG